MANFLLFICFRLEYCGHGFFIATNKNAFAAGFIMLFWVYCGFSGRFHSFLCEIIKRTISNDDLDGLKVVNSTKNENISNSNYHNDRDLMNKNIKAKETGTKYEHYIRDLGWTSKELCVYRGPFDSDSKNLALVDSKNNGSVLRVGTDILNPKAMVDDIRNGKVRVKINNNFIEKNQKFNIYTTIGTNLIYKGVI